jgi:hypothetical protein
MAMSAANVQLQGYFPNLGAVPAAPVAPVAPPAPLAPGFAPTRYAQAPVRGAAAPVATNANPVSALGNISNGPVLPTSGPAIIGAISRAYPAGTMAAVGAAEAIAGRTSAAMAKNVSRVIGDAGEPLLHLSWDLASNVASFFGHAITFQFGPAMSDVGHIFSMGAVDTGNILRRTVEPLSLTSAVSGGARLNPISAVGTGLALGVRAIKSSFVWAIPSAAINAFVDYKYHDVTDGKRIASNFIADVVGYTGAGMAGAAVGAAIGAMTMPIVGTLVGAGVGIALGMLHEKTTRQLISDTLRDQMGK